MILPRLGSSIRSSSRPTRKEVTTLLAMGRVEILSGNPQASLDPLNRGLSLAIQVDNQEQKAMILHVLGAAYPTSTNPTTHSAITSRPWK